VSDSEILKTKGDAVEFQKDATILKYKSSPSVIAALSTFSAEHRLIRGFTSWDIEMIKSDAGNKFNSKEFEQFCADKRVAVFFAPPKH
jgi:hypothetical protein